MVYLVGYFHKKLFLFTEKLELFGKIIRAVKITREDTLARVTSGVKKNEKGMEIISQVYDMFN